MMTEAEAHERVDELMSQVDRERWSLASTAIGKLLDPLPNVERAMAMGAVLGRWAEIEADDDELLERSMDVLRETELMERAEGPYMTIAFAAGLLISVGGQGMDAMDRKAAEGQELLDEARR